MRKLLAGTSALIAVVALVMLWNWRQSAEERALVGLSPGERQAVYQRDLAAFRTLCETAIREEGLAERCRERAEFVLKFPECDSQCRHFAHRFLPGPER